MQQLDSYFCASCASWRRIPGDGPFDTPSRQFANQLLFLLSKQLKNNRTFPVALEVFGASGFVDYYG